MVGRGCVSLMKDPFFPKVSPFTPHVPTIFLQFLFQAIKIFNLVDFFFFFGVANSLSLVKWELKLLITLVLKL